MVAYRYEIPLLVFNSTSYSFGSLTRELLNWTLEEKFHICARPCIILYLSHKLRCYTGISGPEKSRNNTREKKIVFFHVFWYSQSAAYTSLAFSATRSGWWMNGKAFTILNTSCLSELSRIMAVKTLKNPYRWRTMMFKLS